MKEIKYSDVSKGFTLIELIIVVTVLGVIVAIATPSLGRFVKNSRIDREVQSMHLLLSQARQLALSQGRRTFVCRSDDIATPVCKTSTDADWATGKVVYSAAIGASGGDPSANYSNMVVQTVLSALSAEQKRQAIVVVEEPPGNGVTVTSSESDNVVVFSSDGSLKNTGPFFIAVCDDRMEAAGRYLEVGILGRVRVKKTGTETGQIGCDAS